jgi:uncharacterized protein with PQ loop repeat
VRLQELQIIAGVISSLLFAFSTFPMLLKAYQTKDLKSYSLGYLTMSNTGNLVHWVYVSSLPFGPIWFLHSFYTLVTALMLFWYLRYEKVDVFGAASKGLSGLWDRVNPQARRFPGPARLQVRGLCTCPVHCSCRVPNPATRKPGWTLSTRAWVDACVRKFLCAHYGKVAV